MTSLSREGEEVMSLVEKQSPSQPFFGPSRNAPPKKRLRRRLVEKMKIIFHSFTTGPLCPFHEANVSYTPTASQPGDNKTQTKR